MSGQPRFFIVRGRLQRSFLMKASLCRLWHSAILVNIIYRKKLQYFFSFYENKMRQIGKLNLTKMRKKLGAFPKRAVLHHKKSHFALQNGSFWRAEWAVLKLKMGRFGNEKNVKKIQVLCFQALGSFARFACTRPSDFFFRKTAFSEAQNALFVNKIHFCWRCFLSPTIGFRQPLRSRLRTILSHCW